MYLLIKVIHIVTDYLYVFTVFLSHRLTVCFISAKASAVVSSVRAAGERIVGGNLVIKCVSFYLNEH